MISCSYRKSNCFGNQCVFGSRRVSSTDLCHCDYCENQSEDASANIFDKNEDEVKVKDDELEIKSKYSDNDWKIDNGCFVWNVWNYLFLFDSLKFVSILDFQLTLYCSKNIAFANSKF